MNKNTLIIIIAATIGSTVASTIVPRLINGSKEQQINSALVEACNDMNKNCPMLIDQNTRLDATMAGHNEITYQYTVIDLNDEDVIAAKGEIEKINTQTVRTNPATKKLLDNGVKMTYYYKNDDGLHLFNYTVTK